MSPPRPRGRPPFFLLPISHLSEPARKLTARTKSGWSKGAKKVRVAVQRRCRSLEIEVRFRRAAKIMISSWTKSLVWLSSSRRNVVIRPSTALMETLLAMFVPSSAPWRPFGLCVRRSPQQPARHTAPGTVAFGTIGGWFACSSAWVSVARHIGGRPEDRLQANQVDSRL